MNYQIDEQGELYLSLTFNELMLQRKYMELNCDTCLHYDIREAGLSSDDDEKNLCYQCKVCLDNYHRFSGDKSRKVRKEPYIQYWQPKDPHLKVFYGRDIHAWTHF